LQAHGATGLGLSLDGSSAERHDSIRGVPGTFDRTMEAIANAGALNFPLQVNTLVSEETAPDLPAIYNLLKQYKLARWSLFFLISVGRGKVLQPLSAGRAEELMNWVYDTAATAPFTVATTEAPSYRRIALDRMRAEGLTGEAIKRTPAHRSFGIRDGHGVVFVSQTGEICPAGFLPVAAGNVRQDRLADVYRHSDLFKALHDPSHWDDRCGLCEYHAICGGSRARAYSATNDPLAADPLCLYQPHRAPKV
jgi:AdoMet-dependent heme synthase